MWSRVRFAPILAFGLLVVCDCSSQEGDVQSPVRNLSLSGGLHTLFTSGHQLVGTGSKKVFAWNWQDLDAAASEYAVEDTLDASLSADGRILLEADEDGHRTPVHLLQAVDPQTGEAAEIANLGREWYVSKLVCSQNGKHHACLLAFDAVIGDVSTALMDRTRYGIGAVDMSKPDSSWVRPIIHPNRGGGLTLSALAVSEDGKYVAVVGCDGTGGWIHLACPRKGKSLWETVPDGSNAFGAVAFAPDGKVVYAAGTDGHVYAFEVANGRPRSKWAIQEGREIRYGERITGLAASPDGRFVAAGLGPTGDVHIWSTTSGNVVRSWRTRQATMYRLAFSPDSRLLAANGVQGRTVQIWRLPEAVAAETEPAIDVFETIRSAKDEELNSLLDRTPDLPNSRDGYGRTPLHWAVIVDRAEFARALCKLGADVNAEDFGGWTPLHYWAAGDGSREVGRVLLDSGASVKAKTGGNKQWTPLQMAAATGRVEAAEDLIARGADVDARNGYQHTPLHLAATYGRTAVVKVLLEHKADMVVKTKYGGNLPIHLAAEEGHAEIVGLLIAAGTDVDVLNGHERTPLIVAADMSEPKVARLLLEAGADVTFLTPHGRAIHIAARDGSKELIELLLAHGADVNARDSNGWTPLTKARHNLKDTRSVRLQERKDVEAILILHGAK